MVIRAYNGRGPVNVPNGTPWVGPVRVIDSTSPLGLRQASAASLTTSRCCFSPKVFSMISLSTFAARAVVVIGGAAVSLMTWRNAQATGSVAQLLYATETDPPR